jgi:hypothetical protein
LRVAFAAACVEYGEAIEVPEKFEHAVEEPWRLAFHASFFQTRDPLGVLVVQGVGLLRYQTPPGELFTYKIAALALDQDRDNSECSENTGEISTAVSPHLWQSIQRFIGGQAKIV